MPLEYNQTLFTQAALLRLEDLDLVVAVVDGLAKSFLLGIQYMASVDADPFLELGVALVDFVLESVNLQVLVLDFLQKMRDLSWRVGDWITCQQRLELRAGGITYCRARIAQGAKQRPLD